MKAETVVPHLMRRRIDEAHHRLDLDRPVEVREVRGGYAGGGEHALRRAAERRDQLEKTGGGLGPHLARHGRRVDHRLASNVKSNDVQGDLESVSRRCNGMGWPLEPRPCASCTSLTFTWLFKPLSALAPLHGEGRRFGPLGISGCGART